MGSDLLENKNSVASESPDSTKRRQIIDGAREVFLSHGFDAASMGEIARTSGVSKGTLYVYFNSKQCLFEAIVHEEFAAQAQAVFNLDPTDRDVEAVLTRLGRGYVNFLCQPRAISALRTVISISERMPEIGKKFYEAGPAKGIMTLCRYLESQVAAGNFIIEDCEVAAAQFLDSCRATIFRPMLLNAGDAPTDERRNHVVGIAVRTFLAAYGRVPTI